jgi:hypothetical protein
MPCRGLGWCAPRCQSASPSRDLSVPSRDKEEAEQSKPSPLIRPLLSSLDPHLTFPSLILSSMEILDQRLNSLARKPQRLPLTTEASESSIVHRALEGDIKNTSHSDPFIDATERTSRGSLASHSAPSLLLSALWIQSVTDSPLLSYRGTVLLTRLSDSLGRL